MTGRVGYGCAIVGDWSYGLNTLSFGRFGAIHWCGRGLDLELVVS